MPAETQLDYVKQQVAEEIGLYSQRKRFNRRAAFGFTIVPATLAAFATIAIGASEHLKIDWLPLLAMTATGIASILSAWEALFSNRKLWHVNNTALTTLYSLESDIAFRELRPDPISQEETEAFFVRLKAVREQGEADYRSVMGHS